MDRRVKLAGDASEFVNNGVGRADPLGRRVTRHQKWPGESPAIVRSVGMAAAVYGAACAFASAMSASLRNDITVTLRVRYDGSTTCILPSFSYSDT
jgi:hypothetical protein